MDETLEVERFIHGIEESLKPHLADFQRRIDRETKRFVRLREEAAGDRLFRHVVYDLTQAIEHGRRAVEALETCTVALAVCKNYCPHCGCPKSPEKAYCKPACEQCAAIKVPEGKPCSMICVRGISTGDRS